MRRHVLSGVFTACALLAGTAACDNDPVANAHVKLKLTFPDADTKLATKSMLVFTRLREASDRPCADSLFATSGLALEEEGTVLEYPFGSPEINISTADGDVDLYLYPYAQRLERFCSTDAECNGAATGGMCTDIGLDRGSCTTDAQPIAPLAGGCSEVSVREDSTAEASITLVPRGGAGE